MVRAFRNKFSSGVQNVKQNNSVEPSNKHFGGYGKQVKNYVNRERAGLASSNLKDVTKRIEDAHTSINRGVKTLMATLSADIKRLQQTPGFKNNEVMQGKFKQIQEYIKRGKFATRVNNPGNKSINPIMAWDGMRKKMIDAALDVEKGIDKIENLLMAGDFDAARNVARNVNSSKKELNKLLARAVNAAKVENLPDAPQNAPVATQKMINNVNNMIKNANRMKKATSGEMASIFNRLKTEGVNTTVIKNLQNKYTAAHIRALNTKLNSNNTNVMSLRPELFALRGQPGVKNTNAYKSAEKKYAKRFYTKKMGNSMPFNGLSAQHQKSVVNAVLNTNKQNSNKNTSYFTSIVTSTGNTLNPLATNKVRKELEKMPTAAPEPAPEPAANADARAKKMNAVRQRAKNEGFNSLTNEQLNALAKTIQKQNASNLTLEQIKTILGNSSTPITAAKNVAVANEVAEAEATENEVAAGDMNSVTTSPVGLVSQAQKNINRSRNEAAIKEGKMREQQPGNEAGGS